MSILNKPYVINSFPAPQVQDAVYSFACPAATFTATTVAAAAVRINDLRIYFHYSIYP